MSKAEGKIEHARGDGNRWKIIRLHVIAWVIFITYESLAVFLIKHSLPSLGDTALHYLLNIGIFYFNVYFVFAFAEQRRKYFILLLLAGIILEVVLYFFVNYLFNLLFQFFHIPTVWVLQNFAQYVGAICFRALYIIILSTGYWFALHLYRSRVKIEELNRQQLISENNQLELQKKVIATENAFLKSQINPHFLFNALNFIYNSTYKVSHEAADAVMLLSDITRYSLQKSDSKGQQSVNDEIEQIRNIIELNQLRFDHRLQINFEAEDMPGHITIPPLLFITFVENIFKYADLNDPAHPARIEIKLADSKLHFYTENIIQKRKSIVSHGIGLENAKLRLQNAYPQKHRLETGVIGNLYVVNLEIEMAYAEELYSG